MCARLLACPLCSQPGFLTLDALRAGLVSVATRPLACPVCNEVLLGIDKLTIHLFGHTIATGNALVGGGNESAKLVEVAASNAAAMQQSWSVVSGNNAPAHRIVDGSCKESGGARDCSNNGGSGIYIPIDEIDAFRNLTGIKDTAGIINVNGGQSVATTELTAPSQVIFLQNVSSVPSSQPKIISVSPEESNAIVATNNCISLDEPQSMDQSSCRQDDADVERDDDQRPVSDKDVVIIDNAMEESGGEKELYEQSSMLCQILTHTSSTVNNSSQPDYPPVENDRLADLLKSANIAASPMSSCNLDSPKPAAESPEPTAPSPLTATSKLLMKSTRIISNGRQHTERCNICGFHFPDRKILILHKKLVHNIPEKDSNVSPDDLMKNYPCHLCTKVFKMRGSLMVHMRVAHPSFNMVKEGLDLDGQEAEAEQSGEQSRSPNGENAFYNCPVCRKAFKREQLVIQHLKVHDSKQFECDSCGKMFTTKYFLKKHKRLHSGEMPYKCNICDKTFTFQQSYHKHRLYHRDDKPHSCATCGRSFKELSTLHNHERIHTGEKPFVCESCGKCFRQRVSYLVHRRIHTGVMPYECKNCGRVFRYKVSQRTHKCTNQPASNENSPESAPDDSRNNNEESMDATNEDASSSRANDERRFLFALNDDEAQQQQSDALLVAGAAVANAPEKSNNEDSSNSSGFIQRLWNEHAARTGFVEQRDEGNEKADSIVQAIKNTELWSNQASDDACRLSSRENERLLTKEFSGDLWDGSSSAVTSSETGKEPERPLDRDDQAQPDFYSMLESEMPSPSAEMEHLRLSSPVSCCSNRINHSGDDAPQAGADCAVNVVDDNSTYPGAIVDDDDNLINQHFNECNLSHHLQTINEESLKELLSSIP